MAVITLPFGREKVQADIPDHRLAGVLRSKAHGYQAPAGESELVRQALENPIGTPRLRELARDKKNIVIISSDHTRPVPSKIILPELVSEIRAGNPEAQITVLIATGFHRPTTEAELLDKFGEELYLHSGLTFLVHKSGQSENMVPLGTLPSGGQLLINKVAASADLLVSEGFIEPHFFAGFSGGRKSVLPGVCSRTTVLANHCSAFIDSPFARTGILDGNPIHTDMIYAAEAAHLAFICNVVIDADKKIIAAFAGHFNEAHRKGCTFVESLSGVDAVSAPIVISTNGGYPLDQNIYQSVKGMTAAEATCPEGGVIIMVAACADGHGGQSLYDTFASGEDKQAIMDRFLATPSDRTIPDQWEAQILCRVLMKHTVIMVTQAPREMVEAMQMRWAPDLPSAIALADSILGRENSPITVIPDGVSVIVRQK
ncbi:MAG: nickel-dependent lactate racemase [Clostridiales bacterium]|nr:nickel-dependent lactate racemase [Clostridiales bacterium]